MGGKLSVYGVTNEGNVRAENEDRIWFASDGSKAVCVVADGIGGSHDGSIASESIIKSAERFWLRSPEKLKLSGIFSEAHSEIRNISSETGIVSGTTASVLYVNGDTYAIMHVGDSRIYRLSGGLIKKIECLTKDDTWIAKRIEEGVLTEKEALAHPKRHTLTDCIGMRAHYQASEYEGTLAKGDVFMLCSDGLYNCVTIHEMKCVLSRNNKPEKMSENLIHKALSRAGKDNISVIVLKV